MIGRLMVCLAACSACLAAMTSAPAGASTLKTSTVQASSLPQPVSQSGESAACWPLDVVLLIDQSYSMFSSYPLDVPEEQRTPPSDPGNYRFNAAQTVLDRLILDRQRRCREAVHRFSVIAFGDRAEVVLPLTHIDLSENDSPEVWAREFRARLDAAAQDRTQQATDFDKAFRTAEAQFAAAGPLEPPPGYGPRRRLVILVTDGNPAGVGESQPYMCNLVGYLNGPAWEGHHLWILALNASFPYLDNAGGCNGTFRQDWSTVAQAHNGKLLALSYNAQTIPAYLSDIVKDEFGQPGEVIKCGLFHVDPYLQQVAFDFYGPTDLNRPVRLSKLDDETSQVIYQVQQGRVTSGPESLKGMTLAAYSAARGDEHYEISRPRPGKWRFEIEGMSEDECQRQIEARKTSSVAAQVVQPRGVLPQSSDPPYYDPEAPIPFKVLIQTLQGEPVAQEADFPLSIELTFSLPSGSPTLPDGNAVPALRLAPDTRSEGVWTSADQPVLTPELGDYTVSVVGTALRGDRSAPYQVFSRTWPSQFTVEKVNRLRFVIDSPKENEILPCNAVQDGVSAMRPLAIRARVLDSAQQPADLSLYYAPAQLGQVFQASLSDAAGSPIAVVPLLPTGDPGVFEGAWGDSGQTELHCGRMTVKVSFQGPAPSGQFAIPAAEQQVSVERVKSEGVVVSIVTPRAGERLLLHPDVPSALPGGRGAQSVPVVLQLTDLSGNQLDPASVARAAPGDLYRVRVVGAENAVSETLAMQLWLTPDGSQLASSTSVTAGTPGAYFIEVAAQPGAFKRGFMPASEEAIKVVFERYDTFFTSPSTWAMILIVLALVVAAVIVFLVWNATTRPLGHLQFATFKGILLHEERLNRSIRHTFTARYAKDSAVMQATKLSRITVTRAPTEQGKGGRAVKLNAYDEEKQLAYEGVLHSEDSQVEIGDDVWVKYE